jgi:surface protein
MHSSYATKDVFKDYTIPDFMVYDSDVAIAGHKIDIIDTDGSPKQLTLGENDMKTLLMAGILGRQWTYAEGQYPLPDIYGSYFPVEVNKVTYCFNATTADDIPVNRLFSRTAQPKDFLNLSANGYTSKEYETSKVWIDDNFTTGFGALPIGTATIICNDGVIYDRTLTAPASAIAVEKAQLVDVDKDGEVTITAQGSLDFIGDEIIIDKETAYEPMGYNVCLPYSLQLNGPSHVFYPASIQEHDGLQFVTMTESQTIEAWRPCLVTVAQESLPLGTDAQVVFKPKTADSDFKPAGSLYAMIGTKEAQAENGLNYFCLDDDDLWSYTNPSTLLPFRSYFTSTGTDKAMEFTTGMGYRAELVNDTLTFRKGLPLTAEAEEMQWWFIDRAYNNTDDDYFGHLLWSPIAEQVKVVEFAPSFINARPKIMEGWFYGFRYLNTVAGLAYLNTSEVESMFRLFGGCETLTTLDLRHFDTHQVSYMLGMFEDCTHLKKVIIGKDWDIGTFTKPIEMFKGCTSIVGQYGKMYDPNQISQEYANAGPNGYLWKDYPYYVAAKSGDGTLTFQGSDTASDGSTVYDATNTGDGQPAWYDYNFKKVVIEPSFFMARPTSCSYWFAQGLHADQGIQTIEGLENLNTSRATSMKGMFTNCQQATLDVSHFNTHFVTDMSEMFQNCTNLITLDVSHFNTSNVMTMEKMFAGCEHLTTLDVTGLKTFNVETMQDMFSGCKALTELDLNNFNIQRLTNVATMFLRCGELHTIWCDQSWSGISNSANMFAQCYSLKGAVKYVESTTTLDGSMANPETGYFMASPVVSLLDTGDNSEAFAKYDGQIVNVTYDRVLRAIDNGDGTWKRKAYTICLPYDLNIVKDWVDGLVDVYTLYFVKDNKEFVFSESIDGGVLQAGYAYLVVVNEGTVSLNANRVTFTSQPYEGQVVYDWDNEIVKGLWRGTFTKIESAEAAAMLAYSLQRDGYFKRIRPDTPQSWWGAFRSTFCAKELMENNVMKPVYKKYIAGEDPDDPFVDLVDGDGTDGIIHVINNDGTHRYFDLLGRQLQGKPTQKGIYIINGRKVVVK